MTGLPVVVWLLSIVLLIDTGDARRHRCETACHMDEALCELEEIYSHMNVLATRITESVYAVKPLPKDCADIYANGLQSSGVYTVYVGSLKRSLSVYCDMTTDGGGWTVFQRRQDGQVDFFRNWANYSAGFGNVGAEFWLGNDNLYTMTGGQQQYELRIDLADFNDSTRYAKYENFKVASAYDNYRLSIGLFMGTAGDSLTDHNDQQFSTYDQDHDEATFSCSQSFRGAWWYMSCLASNLNGYYYSDPHTTDADGVEWNAWKGNNYSFRFTEMKFRLIPA